MLAAVPVRHTRTVNHHEQKQAQRVHHDMPFPPVRLLMHIHPQAVTAFRTLHTLAVNHRRAGLRLAAFLLAHLRHQRRVELFPQPRVTPAPELRVNGFPGRQVVRQQSPGTAAADDIADGVHYLPHRPNPRTPFRRLGQQWRNHVPFGIIQVSRVGLPVYLVHKPKLTRRLLGHARV